MNNKRNSKKIINNNVVIYNMPISDSSIKRFNSKKSKNKKQNIFKKSKSNENIMKNNLNDLELNTLKYKLALEIDKRTYIQYYFSLLKKKHLILFTFMPINNYNLLSIKISIFIIFFFIFYN